jgi:hypothetical protein
VGCVETFRVRQKNALAGFSAKVNDPPMELYLRIVDRFTGDCAVTDGFRKDEVVLGNGRRFHIFH